MVLAGNRNSTSDEFATNASDEMYLKVEFCKLTTPLTGAAAYLTRLLSMITTELSLNRGVFNSHRFQL